MKSELAEKLFSICGSENIYETYGYNDLKSITQLTEEQRIEIESLLIDNLGFDKIVWVGLPAGLTEDGEKAFVVKTRKIVDAYDEPPHKGEVGYVFTLTFTPKMYEPGEISKPVKGGCVFAPTAYNSETFQNEQSITLTWSPSSLQDVDAPVRTYEDDKQMIREMLEKVLDSPEEYRPVGYTGCLIRYAAVSN
jgi:hypothetical protein